MSTATVRDNNLATPSPALKVLVSRIPALGGGMGLDSFAPSPREPYKSIPGSQSSDTVCN